MRGVERIEQVFRKLNKTGAAAFMPYHAMGYPNRQKSLEVIAALAGAGADLIEFGIPHSDPLADGPTHPNSHLRSARRRHNRGRLSPDGARVT